jgi:Tfp pilus assembly protein PilF
LASFLARLGSPRAVRLAALALTALLLASCSSKEERAKNYYDEGMKLMAAHDTAKASIEFKNAVKLNKNYVPAWRALAQIEELNRNYQGAIPYLHVIVELEPKDIDTKLKLAKLLLAGGATNDALSLVNAVNDLDAHNADALATRAVILLRTKDPAGALKDAKSALEIDPKNATAMSVLAADRLASGDKAAALQLLDKAESASDDKDLSIELFKLKIFEQSHDWAQAEALLKKLVERDPDGGFRNQLIALYLLQKRPDDAEKELRAAIAAKPTDPAPELALVRLLNTFKGPAVARQELVTRISSGNDVFPFQVALAEFDFSQDRFDDSEQLLKSLIANSSAENALTARITLGNMYLARKQLDAADAVVAEIMRKDSRNIDGLRLRASIHIDRAQLEPAINDLREALNDQARSIELMSLLALAYERSGKIELADREYSDAMRTSNFNVAPGLNYVAFLQRRGSGTRAEEVLTDLASRWPQNKQVLSKLAEEKLTRQDWIGAESIAESLKRLGDVGVADQVLGTALLGQNKYDEGVASLKSAYSAAPSAAQPIAALVRAYVRAKQTDKAVTLLQDALKTNPANAEAYVLLGSIQQDNKTPAQAATSYKAAINAQPKNHLGYEALAGLYLSQNNLADAQDVIRSGLKQQPDSPTLHLMLANTFEFKQDYDAAIAEYESMLEKEPGSLIATNNLVSLLADHKTDKASLERAQSLAVSLRKSPVPEFKDTLGWVSYRTGDYKEAVALLEDAAAARPNRPLMHYHLGMSYIASGQLAKAAEQLNTALKQAPSTELKEEIVAALKKTEP